MSRLALFAAPLLLAVGCGGTPPSNTIATSTAPHPPPTDTTTHIAQPPPVPRPNGVLVVARVNDVGRSLDTIDRALKLPTSLRSLLDAAMRSDGADFIKLGASLDVAVVLGPGEDSGDPKFLWAVSIPLKSVDAAVAWGRGRGDTIDETSAGSYRVEVKGGDKFCNLVPSAGDSPGRAVCTSSVDSLTELTPWMARGLAAEPKKPSDFFVRLELAPVKDRYRDVLRTAADKAVREAHGALSGMLRVKDPDLLDAPGVIARELLSFVEDTDAVELSFAIDDKKPEMRLTAALRFRSKTSWGTQALMSVADRPSPPPEMFFRLPKDATTASWARAMDPSLFLGVRSVFHKGLVVLLDQPAFSSLVSEADKRSFLAWADGVPSFSGMWVSASGYFPRKPAPEKDLTAAQAVEEAKNIAKNYLGWSLAGGDGDPAPAIAWLKVTEDALRRAVADVKKALAKDRKNLGWLPTATFTNDPQGFPKGSAALDIDVAFTSRDVWEHLPENKGEGRSSRGHARVAHPAGAEARGHITLRVVVVPDDAGHYWWGYSTDLDALKSHVQAVLQGAPQSGSLATRTDLDVLKNHAGFGGFATYGALIDSLTHSSMMSASERKKLVRLVGALPHNGEGALYLNGSGTGGSAPTFSVDVIAGKDMLEDLGATVSLLLR